MSARGWRRAFTGWLLPLLATAGCVDPGTFSVEFSWKDSRPSAASSLWTFARVERVEASGTTTLVAEAQPARYRPGLVLAFEPVPNGNNYRVTVELRRDKQGAALYFGVSRTFSIEAGHHTKVAVELALQRTPLDEGPVDNSDLEIVEAVPDGSRLLVGSATVTLRMRPTRAATVRVANDVNFLLGMRARRVSSLEPASDAFLWRDWDLNSDVCLGGDCATGSRAVYARFENDQGFASATQRVVAELDEQVPNVAASSLDPALAGSASTVTLVVRATEDLALAPRLHTAPSELGFVLVDTTGNTYTFAYTVDDRAREGVDYQFAVDLADMVGNRASAVPLLSTSKSEGATETTALVLRVDRTPPALADSAVAPAVVRPGDVLAVDFVTTEVLREPARLSLGGMAVDTCLREPGNMGESYHCTASVSADGPDGPRDLSVELVDLAGNRSSLSLGAVQFDLEWPQIVSVALTREPDFPPAYGPEPGRVRLSLTDPATGAPVVAHLVLQTDKDVNAAPTVTAVLDGDEASAIYCSLAAQPNPRRLEYVCAPDMASIAGDYSFRVRWQQPDHTEHTETLQALLQLTTTRPMNGVDLSTTIYRRVPYGSDATAGAPRFSLHGKISPDQAVAEVVAVDASGTQLGRAALVDGEFDIPALASGDALSVSVMSVDLAGNLSVAKPVSQAEWIAAPLATASATQAGLLVASTPRMPSGVRDVGSTQTSVDTGRLRRRDFVAGSGQGALEADGAARFMYLANRLFAVNAAVYDPADGALAVYVTGSFWRWDGDTWVARQSATSVAPSVTYASMAYDTDRRRLVLYGEAQTWEWDERDWHELTVAGPHPSFAHGWLAYDSSLGVTVLYGEHETWEWNGATWQEKTADADPQVDTQSGGMIYDVARNAITLVGNGETWLRIGSGWRRSADAPSLSSPAQAGLGYDIDRGVAVLMASNGVWEWDGQRWLVVDAQPPLATAEVLAYDVARGRVVMFAHDSEDHELTWEWDRTAWHELDSSASPNGRGALLRDARANQSVFFGQGQETWYRRERQWIAANVPPAQFAYDAGRNRFVFVEPPGILEWDRTSFRSVPLNFDVGTCGPQLQYDPDLNEVVILTRTIGYNLWGWDGDKVTFLDSIDLPVSDCSGVSVFDSVSRRLLLLSSESGTWSWDGSWKQLAPHDPALDMYRTAPAFDEQRNRAVIIANDTTTWEFDGQSWQSISVNGQVPVGVRQLSYDPKSRTTIAVDADGSAWSWDGSQWSESTGRMPSSCFVGYDSLRQRTVCLDSDVLWQLDGETWTRATPARSEDASNPGVLTYDPTRERLLRIDATGATSTWTGGSWRREGLGQSSFALYGALFDAQRGRVLGETADANGAPVMMTYDGQHWIEEPATGELPQCAGTIAYDAAGAQVILVDACMALTWGWDGSAWKRLGQPGDAQAVTSAALVLDPDARVVLAIDSSQTSKWADQAWTSSPTAPTLLPGQSIVAAGYDGQARRVVAVTSSRDWSTDTATSAWDGTTWRELEHHGGLGPFEPLPENPPSAAIGFDANLDQLVLQDNLRTWIWDGSAWWPAPELQVPRIAYNTDDGSQLVLSENDQGSDLETWRWDANGWSRADANGAAPVIAGPMTYDAARGVGLLYGPSQPGQFETWTHSGTGWLNVTQAGATPQVLPAGLSFDAARGVSVLFGEGQTWEWNGQWSNRSPAGAAPRSRYGAMTFDNVRGDTLFVGRNEVWSWDGVHWQEITPTGRLPDVDGDGLVYADSEDRALFYARGQTWELDPGGQAALLLDVPLARLRSSSEAVQIDAVTLRAKVGGTGLVDGASIYAWDAFRWKLVACNVASVTTPDEIAWTVSDPAQLRRIQTGEALHFALASVAQRGRPLAKLVTDYVEVSVRYHTSDGPAPVASEPDTNADYACPTTSTP